MKTINVFKKVFISAIVLTMVMALAFSSSKTSVNAALEPDAFSLKGISIRTSGKQGIRFKLSLMDSINPIKTVGLLIAYGDTDTKFDENSIVNGKTVLNGYTDDIDEYGVYYITLYNIPLDQCMQNVTILQYAITESGFTYYDTLHRNINLATIAYKAMNDGIESTLLTDVDTYMNANYKKVYVDEFDNLVFDGFKETNPLVLKEQFINDINQYLETKLTTDSSVIDWVIQLQYNTDITDSKLYQAYNNTKFKNKWSWLFDYLISKGHIKTCEQIRKLNNNSGIPGTDYNNLRNLIYSLYNFFNYDALDTIDSIPFNTESAYSTLTTSNIYPEIEDYDVRKNGTSSALGHKIDITGYTCNWLLNDTTYTSTTDYTVPSSNVKFTFKKICQVKYTISDNQVIIDGPNEDANVTNLVILSSYEGYPTTSIKAEAFYSIDSLKSVTIPASVTNIAKDAFKYCSYLENITVDSNNTVYDSRNNCNAIIETATNTLILGSKNATIPNTVTSIGESAFSALLNISSITIPSSVKSIGKDSFFACMSLTSIVIPESVTSIEDGAFGYCTSLTSITVDSGNTKYDSRDNCNAIVETATNTLVLGCINTVIPNTVTIIGDYAFYGCIELTSFTIPEGVTMIGECAFAACESLLNISISNTVEIIDTSAFGYCTALTTLIIPKSIKNVYSYAFIECTNLTVYIDPSIKTNSWGFFWNSKDNNGTYINVVYGSPE